MARPVHTTLLGSGMPVAEHLTGLANLPDADFRFFAVPVKVKGIGTFPVRAFGLIIAILSPSLHGRANANSDNSGSGSAGHFVVAKPAPASRPAHGRCVMIRDVCSCGRTWALYRSRPMRTIGRSSAGRAAITR